MKKNILILLFFASFLACVNISHAQDRSFSIGTALGGPDGLSYKYWMDDQSALTGLVSFSISENTSRFYTHLDYLRHKFYDELEWEEGRIYYYYGGGLGYEWLEWSGEDLVTLRLPSGVGFDFQDLPFEGYLELAPTFNVSPEFRFTFVGNLGFRYYLN